MVGDGSVMVGDGSDWEAGNDGSVMVGDESDWEAGNDGSVMVGDESDHMFPIFIVLL